MGRLIDADVLIDEIKKDTEKVIKQDDKVGSFWLGYIAGLVIKQPTIQPEPQEGHWIEGGIYRDVIECYCSECGQLMTTAATVRMNYCPNCGARMKGERQK